MPCLVNQTRTVWSRAQESNSNDVMTRPPPTTCPASSTGVSAAESSLDPYPRAANVSSSKKDVQEVQAQCDEHRMCTALRLYHELLCAANIRCRRNILLSQCCNGLTLAHSCMPHTNKQFACYQALRPTCSCFCTPSCQLRETRSILQDTLGSPPTGRRNFSNLSRRAQKKITSALKGKKKVRYHCLTHHLVQNQLLGHG